MKIIIRPDATAACTTVADMMRTVVRAKGRAVLGLATGRTMEAVYADLLSQEARDPVGLSGCTTFNLDEYCGLAPDSAQSYRAYMEAHLFEAAGLTRAQTHVPDGRASDIDAACTAYENAIRAAGGIDLQLLGIGETGHIGFNEPLSSFASRTRRVQLDARTRSQNAEMFAGLDEDVPTDAVTMGVGTILEARRIVLLATGAAKAAIVARALQGPITAMISATALHFHPDVTVVLDTAAAADLVD